MLRRVFGRKREKVTGEWRRLHNEELYALCASTNVIRLIKSRILRWAEHVACMGKRVGAYLVLVGKPKGRTLLNPGLGGRMILK